MPSSFPVEAIDVPTRIDEVHAEVKSKLSGKIAPQNDDFRIVDGTLHIERDLRPDFDLAFDETCNALLREPQTALVINMRKTSYQ